MSKFISTTLICALITNIVLGDEIDYIFKNNTEYEPWKVRILSGIACVVKVSTPVQNDAVTVTESVSKVDSDEVLNISKNVYNCLSLDVINIEYLPAYFHISNISISNALSKNEKLKVFEERKMIYSYDKDAIMNNRNSYVLLESFSLAGSEAIILSHVFSESELEELRAILKKVPKYNADKIGLSYSK